MDRRLKSDKSALSAIAYLTGQYPRATDTFIQREVAALRALGCEILTCSIRPTGKQHHVGESQRREYSNTFYVQPEAYRIIRLTKAHLSLFAQSPKRWCVGLILAWRTRPPGLRALLWQFFYFLEAGVLADQLLRKGIRHLHNHMGDASCSVAMLTSAISGIPFSFTLHGPYIFFAPKWWRIDEKIARARFVVCISHFARSQAMLFSSSAYWSKLKIVHCGVQLANYGHERSGPFSKHILFVGRLDAIKGVPLLLDAFEAVLATHPDARLTIVGDGPDRKMLEQRAGKNSDLISFLGYKSQEEVAGLLQEADILVLPSFAEGVPVVLMEAMASRLPVIASRIAGIPELVEDGVSGFLVPPGDLEMLTDRLVALISDPALCERMGEAGREKVEAEFDVETEAARLVDLFSRK